MNDTAKVVLILAGVTIAVYLVIHSRGKRVPSPWGRIMNHPRNVESEGTDFSPAWVDTAATSDIVTTGESEDGSQPAAPCSQTKSCKCGGH